MPDGRLTEAQFAALAELAGMRGGKPEQAVRLILVDGMTLAEAARDVAMTRQAASNALQRVRRALALARTVAAAA